MAESPWTYGWQNYEEDSWAQSYRAQQQKWSPSREPKFHEPSHVAVLMSAWPQLEPPPDYDWLL